MAWPLYADPDDADDDVHAFALAAVVLEAPHAVRLLVPERLGGRVHTAPAHVRLPIGGCRGWRVGARADDGFVGFGVASALGLVERRCRHQMLHNGAVDDVFEGRRLRALWCRLRNDSAEDRVLSRVCVSFELVSCL